MLIANLIFPSILDMALAPFVWLGVIAVESFVWARVLRTEMRDALRLSFFVNLISGLIGLATVGLPARIAGHNVSIEVIAATLGGLALGSAAVEAIAAKFIDGLDWSDAIRGSLIANLISYVLLIPVVLTWRP